MAAPKTAKLTGRKPRTPAYQHIPLPPRLTPDKQLEAEVQSAVNAAPCGPQGREAHRSSFMWD
jgi:hypothetical protein